MEALVAVSLASNVLQFIQFGCHTVHVCKQIARNKPVTTDIEDHCKELHALAANVRTSIPASAKGQPLSLNAGGNSSDQRLLVIANKLIKIADNLENELAKYRPNGNKSGHRILIKTIKYQWGGKSKIEEFHTTLKSMENTMQSSILIDLRYGGPNLRFILRSGLTISSGTISNLRAHDLNTLDQRTRNFASQLQAGFTKTDDLIRKESADTRSALVDE